jgi:hypothetical protein
MSRYRAERHLMGASARRSRSMAARTTSWYAHDSPRCDTKGSPAQPPEQPGCLSCGRYYRQDILVQGPGQRRDLGDFSALRVGLSFEETLHGVPGRVADVRVAVLARIRQVANHSGRRPDRVRMTWTAVSSAICLLARN